MWVVAMKLSPGHGRDGLGDVPDIPPSPTNTALQPEAGHASLAIVQAAHEHEGDLRLIAIGPLTNVALALKLEPRLPELVHSLTVMGGSAAAGNATPSAEFNFFCDPEAAHLVLESFKNTVMVTWDTVVRLGIPWPEYDEWLGGPGRSKFALFLEHVGRLGAAHDKASASGGQWLVCDPLAVAVAIDPDLILSSKAAYCAIDLHEGRTRGQSRFVWSRLENQVFNVHYIDDVDMEAVKALLRQSVAH